MIAPGLVVAIALSFAGQTLAAQEQVVIGLVIKDARYQTPRFDPPVVRYELRETESYVRSEQAILDHSPDVNTRSDRFVYDQWPVDKDNAIRAFAHFVIDDLWSQDFVPVNEFLLRVQLSSERTNAGPVVQELTFDSRSAIAESYKRQVNELTRVAQPTPAQNQSTYSAALSAITLSPETDNFLLLARALKHSLRTEQDASSAPLSLAQLQALPGFDELSFAEQWTVQTEILDTLTAAPDLGARIDPTRTVLDAAIEIGDGMIQQIDFSNPEQTSLRVVRVYQTLSYLHAQNEDCLSLSENNADALTHSEALDMSWSAQRVLMLDWGTCLERMTGIGSGTAESVLIAQAAANQNLAAAWRAFSDSAALIQDRLSLSTGSATSRLNALLEFATAVAQGGTE